MKPKSVRVYAPATIANLGPGFDVLGLAIDTPGDIVMAARRKEPGLDFHLQTTIHGIPNDMDNVAAHVAQLMLDELKPPFGVSLTLHKKMPLGSGLGSSGASCAAAAVAMNALLSKPLSKKELIHFAIAGEKLASGSAHADNVAPSILGGICLIRCYHPLDIIQLPFKNSFFWVVAHPHIIIPTKMARKMLPTTIPLDTAIGQVGNLGSLITGLSFGKADLIAAALHDHIAEPIRATLIPNFYAIKEAVLAAGAIGFSISGSGPSVFAIAADAYTANHLAIIIKKLFLPLDCDIYISKINPSGSKVVEQSA